MKIAIQFYGFSRFYKQSFPYWKKLFERYDIDLFIHTWDIIEYKWIHPTEKLNVEDIISLYNPTNFVVEPIDKFYDTFFNKSLWIKELKQEFITNNPDYRVFSGIRPVPYVSMWHKWLQVSKLRQEYELKNNFTYDCVINTRTDFKLTELWEFEDLSTITTPPWNGVESWVDYNIGIHDHWAYGSSKDMNLYCSVYDNLENIRDFILENPHKYSGVCLGDSRSNIIKEAINAHVIPAVNLHMNNVSYKKYGNMSGELIWKLENQ